MVAGWRWPWLVVMGVAGAVCAAAVVRLTGWTLSELDQGASVGGLIVAVAALWVAWTQRHPAPQPPASGTGTQAGEIPLTRLPLLGDKNDMHMAIDLLGVHPAIPLPPGAARKSGLDPDLPTWVERDLAPKVRDWLTTAKHEGGFLVLAGDSSVGKTRLLYQAALDVLDGWPVLVSAALGDGTPVNELAARTNDLAEGVVVWLDELHRFLPGPYAGSTPITAGTITRLRDAPIPVIILGALWPEHLNALRATRERPDGTPEAIYPKASDALRDVLVLTLEGLNDSESTAARAAGANDPRLATAAADTKFGVSQTLAGARPLIERYETATSDGKALLSAAIDVQRLGVRPPLGAQLLTATARGYLTGVHPTDDWAQPALDKLSRHDGPHDRGTAPLIKIPDPEHRMVIGYEVADYLLQHTTRIRRSMPIPDATWRALLHHTGDIASLTRLGEAAAHRGLHQHAVAVYRKVNQRPLRVEADTGHQATGRLAQLLAEQGDLGPLRALADTGDQWATRRLVELPAEQGDLGPLRALADTGDQWATRQLAQLLAEQSDLGPLRALADAGDQWAMRRLAQLLDDLGELRALADIGVNDAAQRLAELLAERGEVDELRARADAGDHLTAWRLVELLGERADVEGLRARADAGDHLAAGRLAELLAERGEVDELRTRADADDHWATRQLADLLAERGEVDELRTRADAGDHQAAGRLAQLLAEHGDLDPLRALADADDQLAAWRLAEMLVERGEVDELRTRADADDYTAQLLAELLVERGEADELRTRADAGDHDAAWRLVELLAERGDLGPLRARADAGDNGAAWRLVELLAERGDENGLRAEVDAGTPGALRALRVG